MNIKIININVPNIGASEFLEEALTKLQGKKKGFPGGSDVKKSAHSA